MYNASIKIGAGIWNKCKYTQNAPANTATINKAANLGLPEKPHEYQFQADH